MIDTWLVPIETILILASIILLLLAAMHDVLARTIPNWIPTLLALCGIALRLGDQRLFAGVICGVGVFILAALCWRRGWLGGGDVKLLGAAAIVVPPHLLLSFLVAMSLTGAALGLIYLTGRRIGRPRPRARPPGLLARAWRAERWRFGRGGPLPYACAIAAGGLLTLT